MPDTIMQTDAVPRPSLKNLAVALCKAQAKMGGAKKDVTNPHFNRKYADLASVWSAIREPLTENGLSVVQLLRSIQGGVEVETILLHTSGEQISDVFSVPASKSDAQGFGSAATYARRYSLMAMVGVAPEEDDGNAAAASHKPGAPGSAGGGGDFRPDGPRRQSSWGPGGKEGAVAEAERDGLTKAAAKINTPAAAGDAVKRIAWVKKSIEGFKTASTKDELQEWWKSEAARLEVIETALPTEYERLLVAFDAAIERTAARAA